MASTPKNAADKTQVKDMSDKQRREKEVEVSELKELLSLRAGRNMLWRYLVKCKMFSSTWDHSGSVMSWNEGRRSIGLELLAEITDASPEVYIQMMREAKDKES